MLTSCPVMGAAAGMSIDLERPCSELLREYELPFAAVARVRCRPAPCLAITAECAARTRRREEGAERRGKKKKAAFGGAGI